MTINMTIAIQGASHSWLGRFFCRRAVRFALLALSLLLCSRVSLATTIGYGDLGSSLSEWLWPVRLVNDGQSTLNVTSIELDSSTSTYAVPWSWFNPILANDSPQGYTSLSGVGTQQLLIDLSNDPLAPGEFLKFTSITPNEIPPDPSQNVASIAALGAEVTFTFSDSSTWTGIFTDIPPGPGSLFPDGLYTLQLRENQVPEPISLVLVAMAMALMMLLRRTQRIPIRRIVGVDFSRRGN